MSLGDSILQTASIARCVSVAVTACDHTIFNPSVQAEARPAGREKRYVPRGTLRRFAQVFHVEHFVNTNMYVYKCTKWFVLLDLVSVGPKLGSEAGQGDAHSIASCFDFT